MRKKKICVLGILLLVLTVGLLFGLYIYETKRAEEFVKEFFELSYQCNPQNVDEILEKQNKYYEDTLREIYKHRPPIDAEYIKETEQEMSVVSEIETSTRVNELGNCVVRAEFMVKYKDYSFPEGFTENLMMDVTLKRMGMGKYKILSIGAIGG